MATLREIVYSIKEVLNAYSDDTKVSEEHIAFMVNTKRNMLLKQYMSNLKKTVPIEAMQLICLSLEIDENCLDNKKVMRSTIKIPGTLENTGRNNIVKAYTKQFRLTKNINIIDYSRLPFVGADSYNKYQIFVSIDPDSYLVVYNPDNKHILMEDIQIEGVFENPEQAYDLSCDNANNECDFFDATYPIESSLIDIIKQQIIQELILKYQIPEDKINDGESETTVDTRFFRKNP